MTTSLARRLRALFEKAEPIIVEKVRASRAIYGDADHSELEIKMMLEGGTPITLRMTPHLARQLIVTMTSAYTAINPPLRSGNAAGYLGMTE